MRPLRRAIAATALTLTLTSCSSSGETAGTTAATPPASTSTAKTASETRTSDPCKLLTAKDLAPVMTSEEPSATRPVIKASAQPSEAGKWGPQCEFVGFGTYTVTVAKRDPATHRDFVKDGEYAGEPGFQRLRTADLEGYFYAPNARGTVWVKGSHYRAHLQVFASTTSDKPWFGDAGIDLLKKMGSRLTR